MRTSDFDYDLPIKYIAQTPLKNRDDSRLMILDRKSGAIQHAIFKEIGNYLRAGDVLVSNETRVIPGRLYAQKLSSGGRVEILLLRKRDEYDWEVIVGGKGLVVGIQVKVESSNPEKTAPIGKIVEELEGAERIIHFDQPIEQHLPEIGYVPLPPYIHSRLQDPERYQTVYAKYLGSAAAPTAGLHFTPYLIESLKSQGIQFASLTLHVGLDTFAPVKEEDPRKHIIHTEWCKVPQDTVDLIRQAKANGGRVIAIGTTSVRTLEHAAGSGEINPVEGPTNLFILPGYKFKIIDAMVTNFHLPRSTLIMMVSAFAGKELILQAYEAAKKANYRFYSFGDAMLII